MPKSSKSYTYALIQLSLRVGVEHPAEVSQQEVLQALEGLEVGRVTITSKGAKVFTVDVLEVDDVDQVEDEDGEDDEG